MTKERPILFSGAMVRAILDGRKTQTRRVMSERHRYHFIEASGDLTLCPYGQPGDRLYVREAWAQPVPLDPGPTFYRADYPDNVLGKYENLPPAVAITWKPSIHMPRALSRILLEITAVRIERLRQISLDDCLAEGIDTEGPDYSEGENYSNAGSPVSAERWAFSTLWNSTGGDWEANPWVWVVEFRRATS
ncbi:hypothetical protein [Cupriavidus sp. UME77]|uniref:hypothetical protein n=1 Tax=Cupriavidus sp. UME77 TaxID=1862321 RepID=UPI0016047C87|nr:hypothetical protein [Cupriavidus sp. UME77]MBB1630257.1 hypothetical protein [Cupriavidus sp. UME77]